MPNNQMRIKAPPLKRVLDEGGHGHAAYYVAQLMFARAVRVDGELVYRGGVRKAAAELWHEEFKDYLRRQVTKDLIRNGFRTANRGGHGAWVVPESIENWTYEDSASTRRKAEERISIRDVPPSQVTRRWLCPVLNCTPEPFDSLEARDEHFRRHHKPKKKRTHPVRTNGTRTPVSLREIDILTAVVDEEGLHPREYADKLGLDWRINSGSGARLVRRGLLRGEGSTDARRWFVGPKLEHAHLIVTDVSFKGTLAGAALANHQRAMARLSTTVETDESVAPETRVVAVEKAESNGSVQIMYLENGMFIVHLGKMYRLEEVKG